MLSVVAVFVEFLIVWGLSEVPPAPTDCVGPAATAYDRPHAPRQPNHGIPPIFANTAFS